MATETSDVGLESESHSSVAACWFSIAATTALEPGIERARGRR